MAEATVVENLTGIADDEYPPGEEPPKISEETKNDAAEAPAATEKDEPPPPGVDTEEQKMETEEDDQKPKDNDNLDELTEQKKHSSLGAVLSGLSTGSYGSKAKENVVKVEVSGPRKRYHNDNWGPNKRFGGMGMGGGPFEGGWGGNWGGGGGVGGGWGGNNWNNWNNQYPPYGSYDGYEEEEEEDTRPSEEWIAEETKLLEEEFGPGIISIMYDDDGGMTYVCDICQSQMNGRKSLDVHINGMKHLKKKNIWEKKRRLENFKDSSEDKKDETDEKKSDPTKSLAGNKGGIGTNLGGVPNLYLQPPPVVPGIHPVSFPPPVVAPTNQWNTPPPPPPVAAVQVEEKPKTNLSGGATGTLLQKLAACAVKNLKDSDLATNVIVALVKTMKEYNHGRGDTRSIEVLTEIDVKLRGLKSVMPAVLPEIEKSAPKPAAKNNPANKENSPKPTSVASDPSKTSGNSYYSTGKTDSETPKYSTGGSGKSSYPSSDSGTWYSQGKGSTGQSSYSPQSSDTKNTPPSNNNFTTQPPPKTGYESNKADPGYGNNYSSYNADKGASGYQGKPPVGYYSQPPYSQPPAAVMDIIATAPPPPPPVDSSGYAGYGNQYSGYGGYYNTGPPGPQANNGGYPMKFN